MSVISTNSEQLRVLAALLAMPEEGAFDAVRDMVPQAPWLEPVLPKPQKTTLEHWQTEYTRLFISGYPKTACPPYESAYRHGTMGGNCAAGLRTLYQQAGLEASEVPPDYLGTILEFAAYLQDKHMDDLLAQLVDEHMRQWVPRFSGDLRNEARLDLYHELGLQIGSLFEESSGHG